MRQLYCIIAFFMVMPSLYAALPPAYLAVPSFKACLSTKSMGSYSVYCLPKSQSTTCPDSSWQQLLRTDLTPCDR
ncbi:hypothetical protein BGC07_11300 [Piscirickettsia litoralis]|uniref:Secreted protein n=1 Tax=Piscirickettsia litoralis TaxID=1891921 RepID=A0ABX3A795_9GAMM|nr:hypothetical protein BGC07_11300 [Piscirickettsia litoralis]